MSEEVQMIVQAIESLQGNWVKGYVLPIVAPFASAAAGLFVAYKTIERQEKIKIEREKIGSVNDLILEACNVRSNLIAAKSSYIQRLGTDPLQRAANIPELIADTKPIHFKFSEISFIAPKDEEMHSNWSSIEFIESIFANYNRLLTLIDQRNMFIQNLIEKVSDVDDISIEILVSRLGKPFVVRFLDLTESIIALTDTVLLAACYFLKDFPVEASKKVDRGISKKFGGVLKIEKSFDNDHLKKMRVFEYAPDANYFGISTLFNLSVEQLKEKYRRMYDFKPPQ